MGHSQRRQFTTCIFVICAAICGLNSTDNRTCLAQTIGNQTAPRAAADAFYRDYLPRFGFPMEADLKALQPYLSPRLHSLLRLELRREEAWSSQNPDLKPPVMGDLFTCNAHEHPQGFSVRTTREVGTGVVVDVRFDLIEHNKVVGRCKVAAFFVSIDGKWLLDNVFVNGDVDLKTLLSRKDYTVLPELPRAATRRPKAQSK